MVGFLRAFTAASAVPAAAVAAVALSSSSPSRSPSSRLRFPLPPSLSAFAASSASSSPVRAPTAAPPMAAAATADLSAPDKGTALPELTTEFMVDMKCEGCVTAVKNKLQTLEGIQNIEVDFNNQVVRVRGSLPVKLMLDALRQTGRDARLIGQGNPDDFLVSAAVAEFKGPVIFGVVRLAQVNMELARVEATFSGLSPGKHGWSINEFGDLTKGAESTGKVYNPQDYLSDKLLGDLGTLEAGENGEAQFSGSKEKLKVVDLIGRSIALYATEDRSDAGLAAAVVARSAGVGENYKKLCTCDGVTIWESS
ncbi:copper chaperone for superoxide dismutase, chloroplastic-like [Triticum dicoccoides]|uniref:copper chaperone for superoxide dismutase, chloroplastic-like n=1 Tax=Triticum dicoccoides TaxID=85692 RepID=UPI00188F87A6|nr:copper chaperone for superoxide dismutase, chloroplastic-like [Triticum dicoccoides]